MWRPVWDSPWTDERVKALRDLWQQGLSASQIARRLGNGITRNAVIGKKDRMGLTNSRPREGSHAARTRRRSEKPRKPTTRSAMTGLPLERPPIPPSEPYVPTVIADVKKRVSFADIEDGHCRFPLGEPQQEGFGFCGCAKLAGFPYCQTHAAIAYQAPQPEPEQRTKRNWFVPRIAVKGRIKVIA